MYNFTTISGVECDHRNVGVALPQKINVQHVPHIALWLRRQLLRSELTESEEVGEWIRWRGGVRKDSSKQFVLDGSTDGSLD